VTENRAFRNGRRERKMRTRSLFPLVALVLASCAGEGRVESPKPPERVVLLGSTAGVVSLDPRSGSVLFDEVGVPALGDWSMLFRTTFSEGNTILEARHSATGEVGSSVSIPGELDVRVASQDGSRVALMEPLAAGASPWIPEARASTEIVVADSTAGREPMTFQLKGNFEPEAFSRDGNRLYMISYVPPTAPDAYRVSQLDLATGEVSPVSAGKGVVETMSGTRLEQLAPADGSFLFTLYTTQPPAYAEVRAAHGDPIAFVHTLNLEEGWAHCIGLPKELWGGDPADEAMSVSPDGRHLYVVDSARDFIADISVDLNTWGEGRTATVDFGPDGSGETHAAVAPDGTLFVGTGSQVVKVDTTTFERTDGWSAEDSVLAIGFDGDDVYVLEPGTIEVVDRSTDRRVRAIASPEVKDDVEYVGILDI
jgi:hypothetical protein